MGCAASKSQEVNGSSNRPLTPKKAPVQNGVQKLHKKPARPKSKVSLLHTIFK